MLTSIVISLMALALQATGLVPDPPIRCSSCETWNADVAPVRVFGNTYYVGTKGVSAVLVTSPRGHVLLDAGLPQAAEKIDRNIRSLGFRTQDIKLIVVSHAHFDHVGGVAALARFTGAVVAASPRNADALKMGRPTDDDPQHEIPNNGFPAVAAVRVIGDGQSLTAGDVTVTAHLTPGHTPGSTTWTWQSCDAGRCLNMVYADSLNAVSADEFRFTGDAKTPSRVASFRKSIAAVEALPCDAMIPVHPDFTQPFVDANACKAYAAAARKVLEKRVHDEGGAPLGVTTLRRGTIPGF